MPATLPHVTALIERVTLIPDARAREAFLATLRTPTGPAKTLAFVNAHAFNLAYSDPETAAAFMDADILLRDGKGMELLFKRIGLDPGLNMNGTDLIPQILSATRTTVAIYGTQDPWLRDGCAALATKGIEIVSALDGFQPPETYVEDARKTKPGIIVLAMGMPKQEQLAVQLRAALQDQPVLIVCGGAIIDFIGGRFARAPLWMRKLGLEWGYRLLREPRRLFGRYVIGNVRFLIRMRRLPRRSSDQSARS